MLLLVGKIIPPSQRPDGTWRKARRVKDGYVPQEEVPLYESKGKIFAQRRPPSGPVPGIASTSHPQKPSTLTPPTTTHGPGLVIVKQSRPAKVKQAPQQGGGKAGKQGKNAATNNASSSGSSSQTTNSAQQLASQMERLGLTAEEEKDPEKLLKHVKKLRKKLREIDNIEQKIKSGEIKTPDKDQLDKVARKDLIRIEVERLESNPLLPQAEAMQQLKQQQQSASRPPT